MRSRKRSGSPEIKRSGSGACWARKYQWKPPDPAGDAHLLELLDSWHDVQQRELLNALRVVERKPVGDAPAAVVA